MTGKRFGSKNIDMVKLGREEASNLIKVDLVVDDLYFTSLKLGRFIY
jgi:hypothetical protein